MQRRSIARFAIGLGAIAAVLVSILVLVDRGPDGEAARPDRPASPERSSAAGPQPLRNGANVGSAQPGSEQRVATEDASVGDHAATPDVAVAVGELRRRAGHLVSLALTGTEPNARDVALLVEEVLAALPVKSVEADDAGTQRLELETGDPDLTVFVLRDDPSHATGPDALHDVQIRIDDRAAADVQPFLGGELSSIELELTTMGATPTRATFLVQALPDPGDAAALDHFRNAATSGGVRAGTMLTLQADSVKAMTMQVFARDATEGPEWHQTWSEAVSAQAFVPEHFSRAADLMANLGQP